MGVIGSGGVGTFLFAFLAQATRGQALVALYSSVRHNTSTSNIRDISSDQNDDQPAMGG